MKILSKNVFRKTKIRVKNVFEKMFYVI